MSRFKRDRPLTRQQQEFVKRFVDNGLKGASNAFREAYPASTKWGSNAVRVEASRLLRHPRIDLLVQEARTKGDRSVARTLQTFAISKQKIVERLAFIAFSDIRDIFQQDEAGNLKALPIDQLSDAAAASIRKIRVGRDGVMTVEFADRQAALMQLARLMGFLTDGPTTGTSEAADDETQAERKRARAVFIDELNAIAALRPRMIAPSIPIAGPRVVQDGTTASSGMPAHLPAAPSRLLGSGRAHGPSSSSMAAVG